MLDKNKIYLGDCLELMKEIPDKSVDCIITDPPYGITACKWDVKLDLEAMWKEFKRIRKDNANIVIFSKQPFTTDLIVSNRKEFRYELIWHKPFPTSFHLSSKMPLNKHEEILIFGNKVGVYNIQYGKARQDLIRKEGMKKSNICNQERKEQKLKNIGKELPSSVLFFSNQKGECNNQYRLHPTQKPLELISYLIKTYSNENMLVLDPFSGSGTTAVACHELNRNFICIEKEEEYYKLSCDRLEKAKQQGRLL